MQRHARDTNAFPGKRRHRGHLGYLIAALALSFLAYGSSLPGEFVYDDIPLLVENDCHRGLDRIPKLLLFQEWNACAPRPLRGTSYVIDYALWGLWPPGYHLTNIFLHAIVGWLSLLLFLRLGLSRRSALFAAAFFLIHPIATEAVAYISGRRDLLLALCSLLTAHAYLSFTARGRWYRLLLLLFAMGAALLSHETAAVLPAVLAVLDFCRHWPRDRRGTAAWAVTLRALLQIRCLLALGGTLLLGLAFAVWTVTGRNFSEQTNLWGPNLSAHIGTVFRVHAYYLKQLVWPHPLIADYTPEAFRISQTFFEPGVLLACLLIGGLITGAVLLLRHRPLVSFALLAYFILLLPVSQIIVHHELLAEHRLYLPALCFAGLLGALAAWATRRTPYSWGVVAAMALVWLALTNARNLDWRSPLSLWQATVAQVPRCARAQANLGATLAAQGEFDRARNHLHTALDIRPDLCIAKYNLGQVLLDTGQTNKGLALLQQAAACHPTPGYYLALGNKALGHGRLRLAENAFRAAQRSGPPTAEAFYGLGTTKHRMGDTAGALEHYQQALTLRPDWPRLLFRTAAVRIELCRLDQAEATVSRFARAAPKRTEEQHRLRLLVDTADERCVPIRR